MTSKVNVSLRKLISVSQSLNEISDKLNVQLEAIETALKKMNLGVSAWVRISETSHFEHNFEMTNIEELGYGKHNGRWALLFDDYCEEIGCDPDRIGFLRDAPRESRIKAVEKIPELLDKLAEATEKLKADAAKGITQAQEIADALSNEH